MESNLSIPIMSLQIQKHRLFLSYYFFQDIFFGRCPSLYIAPFQAQKFSEKTMLVLVIDLKNGLSAFFAEISLNDRMKGGFKVDHLLDYNLVDNEVLSCPILVVERVNRVLGIGSGTAVVSSGKTFPKHLSKLTMVACRVLPAGSLIQALDNPLELLSSFNIRDENFWLTSPLGNWKIVFPINQGNPLAKIA